ncbi:hypothetical protein [Flavobacterium aquiphilum]|uniref:hypothetical protein n=1 Tax=Flavobacterium aquiphilum TaxID=3003261 RepID=UPI002480BE55|nr:hypothetical protein [Flavobacterium aquiphilum]
MKKLSFLVLLFIAAACSTESYEEDSALQNNVSKKSIPSSIGTSDTSNFSSAISKFDISNEGQKLLISSINEILRLKQEGASYEEVHAYMVEFQTKVMASNISSKEKEILLPSLSLLQYDTYASTEADDGGRKDRDWELSVGTFKVTSFGTSENFSNTTLNSESFPATE